MFKNLNEVLAPMGLQAPELDVLYPDTEPYTTSIYQPSGRITGNDTSVKNIDQLTANKKHFSFFQLAKENEASLAVTPEYSCPWETVENLLNLVVFPSEKKIWVVGCESIQPGELIAFKNKYKDQYEVIYEDISGLTGNFFDPVCLFFNTHDSQGRARKVVLIQFKTKPLGDAPEHFERDRLIRGTQIYIFEGRSHHSIKFSTLICSDVLRITTNELDVLATRSLILHIQLNQNPRSEVYAYYRKFLFQTINPDNEVIAVNWAENVYCEDTEPKDWNNISGSGIYFRSEKIDLTDARVNKNHRLGLYLTYWTAMRTFVYYFNYLEHIFTFKNVKPFQHYGVPQQSGRTGPEMVATKYWDNVNGWQTSNCVEDGFTAACSRVSGNFQTLKDLADRPIDIERLLTLSNGLVTNDKWQNVQSQPFFRIDTNEFVNRISFAQDGHPGSVAGRDDTLKRFGVLSYIITLPQNFPRMISDLHGTCKLEASTVDPIRNLISKGIGAPATVVYLGDSATLPEVKKAYSDLRMILSLSKKDYFRVVIWYRDIAGNTQFFPVDINTDADADPDEHPTSITRSLE